MKVRDNDRCNAWYQALLERDSEYTGVFFVGVKTTGVFCISVCRARKPKRENVEFYKDMKSALDAGFRPCKVCRPTENAHTAPLIITQALELVRANPKTRISDAELRKHDISPERVRRWFLQNHGITFQSFQRMQRVNVALVWQGLRAVPYGLTSHYQALSRQIGQPNAVRAVAVANGANRVAIVIPCHRIIGKDGTMTGYGGGIARKEWLIEHERKIALKELNQADS